MEKNISDKKRGILLPKNEGFSTELENYLHDFVENFAPICRGEQ